MRKLLLLFSLLLTLPLSLSAETYSVSYDNLASISPTTAPKSNHVLLKNDNIGWDITSNSTYLAKDGTAPKGIKVGKKAEPATIATFASSDNDNSPFKGKIIKSATINAGGTASITEPTLEFYVDEIIVGTESLSGGTHTTCTFENINIICENSVKIVLQQTNTSTSKANALVLGDFSIEYEDAPTSSVATPAFSVNGGWVASGTSVEVTCSTEGASIYYTLDGSEPTAESTLYNGAITISDDIIIKAIAVKDDESSAVATASYIVYPANSAENPISVAKANELIDANVDNTIDFYVKGIISSVDKYNSTYNSLTYYIRDEVEEAVELEIYSGLGLNGAGFSGVDDLSVGDIVIVCGKLKKYNSTNEMDMNSYIVSITSPTLDPVATPTISCSDNIVTINCETEGASVVYSIDGTTPSVSYTEPFAITETCTVKAKATKTGMADSEVVELECVYVVPAVKPSMPVVTIEGVAVEEEEIAVDYGTKISVSSENATSLVVEYGDETETIEGSSYDFDATANETYMITPLNENMPEDEMEGDAAMFTITINAPEILSVLNGEELIEEFSSILAKEGTEILVNAKSYTEIAVENEDGAVSVTDGKFSISGEGSYIITVSNPAYTEKAEMMFEVTYPEEPEFEINETLDWIITGVNGEILKTGNGSANGDWEITTTGATSTNNGCAQLGTNKAPCGGCTLTLSDSDIPENAIITAITMKGIPGNINMSWTLSVNGVDAEQTLTFPPAGTSYGTANHSEKTISDLNLTGNQIVLTLNEDASKAFYLSGISVSYYTLAEPSAPEFDMPATIEHGSTIVYTVKRGKIHYHITNAKTTNNSMLRVSEPTDDWTVAKENGGKQFTYEYVAGNNHNIYVKNVVNGQEAHAEPININASGVVTGIEAVGADVENGEAELYNLQGVRVNRATALPGLYIERRNGKATKVVL